MAKKANQFISRDQPLTPAVLSEYGALDDLSPPLGTFDPQSQWKHTYQLWLVGGSGSHYGGFLRIEHVPASDNRSAGLNVQKSILQAAKTVHHTKAAVQCASDTLSTPRSWQLDSVVVNHTGEPFEISRVKETATVNNDTIESKIGKRVARRKVPGILTSNWSLFAAVQRLPGEKTKPLEFTMLEDLDLVKPGQRLSYRPETFNVVMGGKPVQLHGYQQIGQGILPLIYWLDDQHRLILAISHTMTYIFDPEAEQRMDKVLQASPREIARKRVRSDKKK